MTSVETDWCLTTATDTREFYYNPEYISELSLAQTEFILAHEALHCALSHFSRRQHRSKQRWDLACDFAVNPILVAEGLTATPDALYLDEYQGMTAEEIYPLIEDNPQQQTPDNHLYDAGTDGQSEQSRQAPGMMPDNDQTGGSDARKQPPPLDDQESRSQQTRWRQRLASAATQARQAGKLSAELGRLVDHYLQPTLPWRSLLARYMMLRGRDDFNYARPSRRSGEAILPALKSTQIDVCVFIDTSGSLSDTEIDEFINEVNAIKGQVHARITLHACDVELSEAGPWVYEPWQTMQLPDQLGGGGGTSFIPPFEWLDQTCQRPDLVIYFTDAQGKFPARPADMPVLWLVKGRRQIPWGERIQLN